MFTVLLLACPPTGGWARMAKQAKLCSLTHCSPAVWPRSYQATEWYQSAARSWGPLLKATYFSNNNQNVFNGSDNWLKVEHSIETELNRYKTMFLFSGILRIMQTCTQRAFFLIIYKKSWINDSGQCMMVLNMTHQCYWTRRSVLNQTTVATTSLWAPWGVGWQDGHAFFYRPSHRLSLE